MKLFIISYDHTMPFQLSALFNIQQVTACSVAMMFCGLFATAIGIEEKHLIVSWCGGVAILTGIVMMLIVMFQHIVVCRNERQPEPPGPRQQLYEAEPVIVIYMPRIIRVPRITQFVADSNTCIFCSFR